ncbi:hypothetical protein CRG98_035558, partial [Punica granatum]
LRVRDPRVGSSDSPWKNGSARELRARHGARPGSLDSLGADLGVRERRIGGKGSYARSVGPRTVTTSSRGRVRVVRNPLNVMARLAEVVGRNGTWLARCVRLGGSRDPNVLTVEMGCRKLQIENLSLEMDLGGGKYVLGDHYEVLGDRCDLCFSWTCPEGSPGDIRDHWNVPRETKSSFGRSSEARQGNHLHRLATHYGRLNRGIPVPPLSHFFPGPPLIIGSTSDGPSSDFDDTTDALPTVYAVTEEIPSGVHIRPAQENEELNNWTSVLRYSAVIADVLHSNPNLRHVDSNPSEDCLGEPGPIYFGEGLDEDSLVPEIEESLRRLEDRQLTSLEPTEEINVGTEEEPRILKIGTSLDPTQRVRMIDFLTSTRLPRTIELQPLFRLLRKNAAIEWDEECQKAFDTIKAYLVQPPVLVPPTPGRPLVLYLTRLRQYTLYHTIRSLSKADPLKYLLDSPSSTRNLVKWRCQLTEYDIEYVSRTSVKGQAIVDHLAEFPIEDHTLINPDFPDEGILQVDDEREKPGWKMYFDGAVNSMGSGIGAVLISPDGRDYPVAAKIDFPCTNNVAEYEVYADQIKAPPNELRPMTAPWPFSMWGMDVIGPINPKASNGHMFILVVIDYFTKWIEAVTLASVTAKAVARFLRRDVIARYG